MKYRLLKEIPYNKTYNEVKYMYPTEISLLIHCGFLEEVRDENTICDHKWEVTLTDKKQFNHCTACNKCEVVMR